MHPAKLVLFLCVALTLCLPLAMAGDSACPNCPQARITNLPEDGSCGYVSLFYHDDWQKRPAEKALIETWLSSPDVQDAIGTGHYLTYNESDPQYRHSLKQRAPTLPTIIVQDATGKVLFKDHADPSPAAGVEVDVSALKRKPPFFKRTITLERGEQAVPKPDVNVVVAPQPVPDKVPIAEPKPKGEDPKEFGTTLAVVCGIVAIAAAVFFFRRRVSASPVV